MRVGALLLNLAYYFSRNKRSYQGVSGVLFTITNAVENSDSIVWKMMQNSRLISRIIHYPHLLSTQFTEVVCGCGKFYPYSAVFLAFFGVVKVAVEKSLLFLVLYAYLSKAKT